MIPAHMAGIYPLDACGIDLRPWAERIGARFLECAATGLDADRRVVFRLCNPFSVNFRFGCHEPGLRVEVEINLTGQPLVVEFGQQSGDQAQAGFRIREDARHSSPSAQLPVDTLQAVGGAQPGAMGRREVEDGQTLRDGFLGPSGEVGMFLAPGLERAFQEPLGLGPVGGFDDGAHPGCHRFSSLPTSDEPAGVLLQREPAALPGYRGEHGPTGGLQAGVIVGDDESDPFQPSGQEAFQKAPPADVRFRGGDLATEDATLARGLDADGHEHGAIDDASF